MNLDQITVEEWEAELKEKYPDLYQILHYLELAYLSELIKFKRADPESKFQARLYMRKDMVKRGIDPDLILAPHWPKKDNDDVSSVEA